MKRTTPNKTGRPINLDASVPCYVLLPKAKTSMFPEAFTNFSTALVNKFGGYTMQGEVRGKWLDREVGLILDETDSVVMVAIHPADRPALNQIVAAAAHALEERAIFLTVGTTATYFVWAAPASVAVVSETHETN